MPEMRWKQKRIYRPQRNPRSIGKFQHGLALQNQHPFVLLLDLEKKKALWAVLAKGEDPFNWHCLPPAEDLDDFLRAGRRKVCEKVSYLEVGGRWRGSAHRGRRLAAGNLQAYP